MILVSKLAVFVCGAHLGQIDCQTLCESILWPTDGSSWNGESKCEAGNVGDVNLPLFLDVMEAYQIAQEDCA
eukprot:1735933-Amphidinium_carterae.1